MPPHSGPRTVDEILALKRPLVLAHTGGEDAYPGSTMFAFAQSVKDGVDMLDLNVILSSDGVLMVQHDDTVDRNTNGTGPVANQTAAELGALDDAYWFTTECGVCADRPAAEYVYRGVRTGKVPPPAGYTADDFAMPTFRSVVERFPDYPLNIEIKGNGAAARAAADQLAKDLTELKRIDASVVTSFDDEIVSYFHTLLPDVEMSPGLNVTAAWVLQRTPLPDGMRILQLPPVYENGADEVPVITPDLIAAAKTAKYPIWVWPNNRQLENQQQYLAYLKMGLEGLNINFPAQGVAAAEEYVTETGDDTSASTTDTAD